MGYQLNLSKKTGFRVADPNQPIIIVDHRGIVFYTTEPILEAGRKVYAFNLPKGVYMVKTGYFDASIYPVKYPQIPLPFPQRFLAEPDDFKVVFASNPNKCTILWNEKTIIFDTSFKEKPLYEIFFILFHEYGHSLYNGTKKGEMYADLFAANKMLKHGFNPMQIGSGQLFSLSDRQLERKGFLTDKLNNYVNVR